VAGPEVKLVDLSRGGALLEVASRFALRSSVRLKLTKPSGEVVVADGCVARAKVAALVNGQINYRFAVIFEQPLQDLPAAAADAQQEEAHDAVSPRSGVASLVSGDASPEQPVRPAIAAVPRALRDASASSHVTDAAGQPACAAGEDVQAIEPARGNLTRHPSRAPRSTENPPSAEGARELAERRRSITADTRADDLRRGLAAATAELARQSMINQSLTAKLEEFDELRTALRGALETERRRWKDELAAANADLARQSTANQSLAAKLQESDELQAALRSELETERRWLEEERSISERQMADAAAKVAALQAALDTREQEQARVLAEQQGKYEALVAELVTTTNDQQSEFQNLLEELTADRDEQRRLAEHHEADRAPPCH
jgi:hypothetical protein